MKQSLTIYLWQAWELDNMRPAYATWDYLKKNKENKIIEKKNIQYNSECDSVYLYSQHFDRQKQESRHKFKVSYG